MLQVKLYLIIRFHGNVPITYKPSHIFNIHTRKLTRWGVNFNKESGHKSTTRNFLKNDISAQVLFTHFGGENQWAGLHTIGTFP